MLTQSSLQRTPVYHQHLALKARMVPFGGWEMPVQYDGIISEYHHTRQAASLFDISHMGEFVVDGDCVECGLDRIVTMSLVDLPVHSCRYGCMLNEQGGVIDDLIVFREEEEKWFIVVNGATTQKDAKHFEEHINSKGAFGDISSHIGKLDLQGPLSREVLIKFVEEIKKLNYYTFDYFDLLGERVLISRTGYTGELGYEIYYPWDKTELLWKTLLEDERVKPAGLGARDVLRIEMGYSLYGHEINEDISVLESGLDRFVDFNKNFIGKEALLEQQDNGVKRKIIGFTCDSRRSPREGHNIFAEDEGEVGIVTSGTFSPSLQKGIGLGFVSVDMADKNKKILFGNEKSKINAIITGKTFYKNGSLRN